MTSSPATGGFRFEIAETAETLAQKAAAIILAQLRKKPNLLLCASAGGTPTLTYGRLADEARRRPALFRGIRILQIDEWAGLPPQSPATCESDLRQKLLVPLGISRDRYIGFKSDAPNPARECSRIWRWLQAHGPIDICILGLGANGHVAMNEPGPASLPHAHVARLARSSQKHPLLKDLSRKPKFGLTLGMSDILRAKRILLLVSGSHKRVPLQRLTQPKVTPRFPASLLWLHPDATVVCDKEAASNL